MTAVNPLSNPKGVNLLCELCQKPAFVQCTHCRVTYYCSVEHQQSDWSSIHIKICQLLIPLRTPGIFMHSEEDRSHFKQQQHKRQLQLATIASTVAHKLLFEGRYTEAVPAAIQSLRFAIDIHGLTSVELVPSYLTLAEASIGMKKLREAEDYLSQAQWTVLKNESCSNAIRSKVCRNLGLLYVAKEEYSQAQLQLANDIFYASEEYGPFDIETSGGYFYMANTFLAEGKTVVARPLYEQVVNIWYQYLDRIVQLRLEETKPTQDLLNLQKTSPQDVSSEEEFDEAKQAEAVKVLHAVYSLWCTADSNMADQKTLVAHSLCLLYYLMNDSSKAKEFGRKAVAFSEGVHDEEFSMKVVEFLKLCENVVS